MSPVVGNAVEVQGKFAPESGKVLVFAGQDNASVGGTAEYRDGYVDNVGVPGGITHYVYFSEGWTNGFDRTFAEGEVAGLNRETEWASGPMHQKAYLESAILKRCVMHVSIAMEGNCEDKVADGSFDHLIAEFVDFVAAYPDRPFLIRIGYEFDGSWNDYDPENFKLAFRRIVDALRARKLQNFATVFASSSSVKAGQFEEYDPGANYYDWVGYSWWGGEKDGQPALDFARSVGKPVFIAEATARGHYFGKEDAEVLWNDWFTTFFKHIDDNIDVIRAISYINADWDSQDMWDGWGQTKLESAPLLKQRWLERMADPMFINAIDKPLQHIGFLESDLSPVDGQGWPYQDAELPVQERVSDLLARMTLEEKVAQITGWWDPSEEKLREEGVIFGSKFFAEKCPNGIGELGPLHNLTVDEDARLYAAVQKHFRKNTRLGIPAILHDEAAHGFMRFEANSFPTPIGLSCTWNVDLMREIYSQAGREARSRGVSHVLSPILDVARDLRWGRVDETLGEDPYLVGHLGAAMVRGLQGSADGTIAPNHVAATLKHFAGYAGTEGGRNRSPYVHGPRELLDTEVVPFRHVIQDAKPAAVMAAFNEVEGVPCHVNSWVLGDLLRGQLGFQGLVVGDYQGIDLVRSYQKIGKSDADAGRMALEAGLQLELPNNFGFKYLPELVKAGSMDERLIDQAVAEVLELKFRMGLFEAPMQIDVPRAKSLASSETARELSREAARQSIVLLKNEGRVLPLTPGKHGTIAVIGPNADVCRLGNYSGRPLKTVSLLEGLRTRLGDAATVLHAEGCKIALNDADDSYANWRYVNEVEFATLKDNEGLIAEAIQVAKQADLVVLALGENVLLGREAWGGNHVGDRTTMDLTESQRVLADAVLATGKPVVLFLNNSKPVTLHELGDRIPAILTAHYAGQETGTAAAEILFGDTNPSGKLTLSWPRSVGHLPAHYSQQQSSQIFDYVDSRRDAVYPFGHGLSYTTFKYGRLQLSAAEIHPADIIEATVTVTNTGQRAGTEIAQLYVTGESFAIARPGLELKGFRRVSLEPGQSQNVIFQIKADDLSFHDTSLNRVLPSGKYLVRVGGASADLGEARTLVTHVEPRWVPLDASADARRPHSGVPHSGVPHSGVPHSGVPHSSVPHSGVPHSRVPHSGVPHSGVPHSGVPHSGVPHSGVPHSGVPHSGVPKTETPHSGVPVLGVKSAEKPAPVKSRPNVLFIAIDDLRPELGTYGTDVITPNIDRLAASGVRFDQAYCQQAVCGASRLSLMSGLYPIRTGEQTFHVSGWRDRHPNVLTMNQHFGQQGYSTIGLGKIYHGHSGRGVDLKNWGRWVDISAAHYAKPENLETLARVQAEGKVGDEKDPAKGPLTESADVHDDTYMDGKRAAEATRILENLASDQQQPFFLAVGFAKPHLPFVAPQKYWDLYERADFKMPPNQSIPKGYPEHAANLMAHEMHKYSDFEGESPADFSDDLNLRLLHGYAATTSYADACVGRVLDTLEQTGLAENTIVVLWGDHGWKLGDHGSWTKHTNFECDARTPLIIRDPRISETEPSPRLVELIDLYPTLCDLAGIPVPGHCQGRSFRTLLTEPESGHRYDAYSSYPAYKMLGHSLRFGNYRYTEWRDDAEEVKARVLTNLKKDPGEVTNLVDDPKHAEAVARAEERLSLRINLARKPAMRQQPDVARAIESSVAVASVTEMQTEPTMEDRLGVTASTGKVKSHNMIKLDVQEERVRQSIDGFGGSIAFWGVNADDKALEAAINGLNVSIVRVQGEVSKTGDAERNRDVLQRATRVNPDLQVLLTFWQPRSAKHPDNNYWLDIVESNGAEQFRLKPSREDEWADEMIARVLQHQKWGVNVEVVAVQNESNWSHPGTQTCGWEPLRLANFVEQKVRPRLDAAGLSQVKLAAPDLAYLGDNASEVQRFLPTLTSPSVEVAAYHMYDSFVEGQDGGIGNLLEKTQALGQMRQQNFPSKRLWMTETTGAQWNGAQWHTFGWTPDLSEHDKAILAARYIHMTLSDAEANAFLWWGLIYSLAPERVTDPNTRQKHRDEGLVLVQEETQNGFQAFLERTKKYYAFRQYSGFVRPGYQRLAVDSPTHLQVSAYRSPDRAKLVVVVVNDSNDVHDVQFSAPADYKLSQVRQTDRQRDCEPVPASEAMPGKSVRTVVFER